jgi:predicted P-loop ATPase
MNPHPDFTPEAARQSGWSIIPTGLDKKPIVTTWKPYQSRQPTDAEFLAWRALNPPTWALITGALSRRITLDFDGAVGGQTLDSLELVPHRATPSGGFHVDFRHPGWHVPTVNSKSKIELGKRWPGLDIRADGGYVVFTGHTRIGKYQWLRDADPYELSILPNDLRDFLGLLNPPPPPNGHSNGHASGRVDADRLIRSALDRMAKEGRNNAGFWLAGQLRDNGFSESEAESTMRSYRGYCPSVNAKGQPEPYAESEMLASLREAFKRPARDPWTPKNAGPIPNNGSASMGEPPAAPPPDIDPDWELKLIVSDKGKRLPILANAVIVLENHPDWAGVMAYNEFSLCVVTKRRAPWQKVSGANWTDSDSSEAAIWLQHHGVIVGSNIAREAAVTVAMKNPFHPVREYLLGLKWDSTERLDHWLIDYISVEDAPYTRAVGAKWMLSAVARIFEPGCQADYTLLFEGDQGIRKSSALRALAGNDWFTDHISPLDSKDARMDLCGVWILEHAELSGIRAAVSEKVKSFLTARVDHFRKPYGHIAEFVPRQVVFCGSVNNAAPFNDETGNRRFWPVRCCGGIDVSGIKAARDQLWAEAVHRYRANEPRWLQTKELEKAAREEQDQRFASGVWDDSIIAWLDHPRGRMGQEIIESTREQVTISDILQHCIGKEMGRWDQKDQNLVSRCLVHAGWKRRHIGPRECRKWVYQRPEETA